MKNKILKTLKNDARLWEKDEFNQTLLIDLVEKYDETIIDNLFNNADIKQQFFIKIKQSWVFKIRDFVFFMEENKVNNSFTDYKNRIGLSDGKRFLKDTQDVVLDFPFKDCILEGGQSTDEGLDSFYEYDENISAKEEKLGHQPNQYNLKKSKRKEVFFNQVLAKDEIDRLLDPKALTNGKRFSKNGVQKAQTFNRDENGKICDNLIIKGNNLLALQTLKSNFAGKVKLIYIDPPYNTGGDANIFTYNNNFNHSTWLTFMKNRLEAGKQLLRDDGFIAIAIDHEELFYLGVLTDEIFNRENQVGIVTILHNPKGRNQAKFFSGNSDFMVIYAKNIKNATFRDVAISEEVKESFNNKDEKGAFRYEPYMRARTVWSRENRPKNWYPIYVSKDLKDITHEKKNNYFEVYPITNNGKEMAWKNVQEKFIKLNENKYFIAKEENHKIKIYHKYREQQVFKNVWTDKKYQSEFHGTNLLKKILDETKFSYPKSLYTVLDTIKIMTSDDDIILDFHAGSGTTGHAILALNKEDGGNRKFILVEQLDQHIKVCNERIYKVMQQENINDSFVYCELAKWNQQAKEKILACKDLKTLINLFDELYNQYFLNYNLKIKEFREKVIKEDNFKNLDLTQQKEMFLTMLDLNQMYVNKSEMADKKYGLSADDQNLTKDFYQSN